MYTGLSRDPSDGKCPPLPTPHTIAGRNMHSRPTYVSVRKKVKCHYTNLNFNKCSNSLTQIFKMKLSENLLSQPLEHPAKINNNHKNSFQFKPK